MKKHNVIKVVLVTILLFLLLSWILPAAYYSGEYVDQGRVQMGLFDMFNYPMTAIAYFGYIAFYFILIGGLYGILYKIPAYRLFLERIVEKAKGKENICLAIMIILISLLVSVCGVHIAYALFIPFIVSYILMLGYDKITALFVTVGSISVGLIGSTYAYNNMSVLMQTLNLKLDYNIGVRFIILLVGIVLVIFNTLMYNKSHKVGEQVSKKDDKKKDIPEKIEVAEEKEEEVVEVKEEVSKKKEVAKSSSKNSNSKNNSSKKSSSSKKSTSKSKKNVHKAALMDEDIIVVKAEEESLVPKMNSKKTRIMPLVIIFSLLFILFVLAFIPWGDNGFKIKFFTDLTKNTTDFKLFGFPLFAKVLGTFNAFGSWTVTDLFLPMFLSILLLIIIYRVKFDDVIDGFIEGAKRAIAPAFVALLMYTILVICTYHPFQMTIYKTVLGWAKGFNVATTVIVSILSGFFNSDMAYSFQSILPYYASVVNKVKDYSLVGVIFQSMYGFTMLFAPTSLILMATLSYVGESYKNWLKSAWKLLVELFVILLIVFIILALM